MSIGGRTSKNVILITMLSGSAITKTKSGIPESINNELRGKDKFGNEKFTFTGD